jgi:type II secretory pathway predicted ATPase ExeA/cell division septation protein DedD
MALHEPRPVLSFQSVSETLVYEPFFKLTEKAFSLNSDLRFHFESPAHAASLKGLQDGIRRREGLTVLTGEIGSGKTMLCRAALRRLGRNTFGSFVPDPFSSREDLLKTLLIDFGVVSIEEVRTGALRGVSRTELSYVLAGFLESMTPLESYAVVFLDEAQSLTLPVIEETRVLHDTFGASGQLQIVFVGQLELHTKLKSAEMRQVDQRITCYTRLAPLDKESTGNYIRHRLQVAGHSGEPELFSPEVVDAIYRRSGVIPRLVNRICDRALTVAYEHQSPIVDHTSLNEALTSIGFETFTPTWASIVFSEPLGSGPTPPDSSSTTASAVTSPTVEPLAPIAPLEKVPSAAASQALPSARADDNSWLSRLDDFDDQHSLMEMISRLNDIAAEPDEVAEPPSEVAERLTEAAEPVNDVIEPPAEVAEKPTELAEKANRVAETTSDIDAHPRARSYGSYQPRPPQRASRSGIAAPRAAAWRSMLPADAPNEWHRRLAIAGALAAAVLVTLFLFRGFGSSDAVADRVPETPASGAPSAPVADTPRPTTDTAPPPSATAPIAAPAAAPPPRATASPVTQPPVAPATGPTEYFLAIGLYNNGSFADMVVAKLVVMNLPAQRRSINLRGKQLEQVLVGPFSSRTAAAESLARLQDYAGYEDARVIQVPVTPIPPS